MGTMMKYATANAPAPIRAHAMRSLMRPDMHTGYYVWKFRKSAEP